MSSSSSHSGLSSSSSSSSSACSSSAGTTSGGWVDDSLLTLDVAVAVALGAPTSHGRLGLPDTAGLPEGAVRKRYLLLARLLHPDKNSGDALAAHAEEAFKRVKDAYGEIKSSASGAASR